jgi:hypothetical protein
MVDGAANLEVYHPLEVFVESVILLGDFALNLLTEPLHYVHFEVYLNVGVLQLLRGRP